METDNVIRFDWAAKNIFRDKADFTILQGLVSAILGEKVTITELLESEGNQQHKQDKFNRVDIKAVNSLGEIILIEVQQSDDLNFLKRILYSTAKTITEHISSGKDYENVKKVFSSFIDPETRVPGLREAKERLDVLKMSPEERKRYEDYRFERHYDENMLKAARYVGREEGREEGLVKGREEEREAIARKMLEAGATPAFIKEITGIDIKKKRNNPP